jgi:type IV pilus assembly protein PilC
MAAKALKVKENLFIWEGADKRGAKVKGEQRAPNPNVLRADLRRQGLSNLKIKKKSAFSESFSQKSIKPKDIAILFRQMATMMSAGVPLVSTFEIIGRGHENPKMMELVLTIKADIESGTALTEALAKHPQYFDELACNLVRAGEHAGVLETVLHKIATYKERMESIKAKVKKAMFYPAAVLVVAFVVTAVLLVFVVPTFKDLFEDFGAELPAFTLFVLWLSDKVQEWGWLIALAIGGGIWALVRARKRSAKVRYTMDRLALKIPVVGLILDKSAIARYARTLSTMFAAGVPLVEALDSVAGATGNIVYGNAVRQIRDNVATGQQLQLAMRQTGLFPHMVVQMTAIGEESGSLDAMLTKVADFYEEEVNNLVDAMSSLLEPIILVIIGVLVGGLIIAMYLPIFKLGAVI